MCVPKVCSKGVFPRCVPSLCVGFACVPKVCSQGVFPACVLGCSQAPVGVTTQVVTPKVCSQGVFPRPVGVTTEEVTPTGA